MFIRVTDQGSRVYFFMIYTPESFFYPKMYLSMNIVFVLSILSIIQIVKILSCHILLIIKTLISLSLHPPYHYKTSLWYHLKK